MLEYYRVIATTIYRITSIMKVETHIIANIVVSPTERPVIIYVETFKTDVIEFIGNDTMCLTLH
jgi:hypothetical protein